MVFLLKISAQYACLLGTGGGCLLTGKNVRGNVKWAIGYCGLHVTRGSGRCVSAKLIIFGAVDMDEIAEESIVLEKKGTSNGTLRDC